MDEAASKIRMEINSKPEELDVLDRKVQQEIEIEAIKREKTRANSKSRNELANLKEDRNIIYSKMEIRERCGDNA
jgi:ATP-dependent Clp protease ATP-binding subunit ClpB